MNLFVFHINVVCISPNDLALNALRTKPGAILDCTNQIFALIEVVVPHDLFIQSVSLVFAFLGG